MESCMVNGKWVTLDKTAFRAWLASREIVGYVCGDGNCPIAAWLNEQYDQYFYVYHDGTVDCWDVETGSYKEGVAAAGWVGTFAYQIDQAGSFVEGVPIWASEALDVFDHYCCA